MMQRRSGLVFTLLLGAAMLLPCEACLSDGDEGAEAACAGSPASPAAGASQRCLPDKDVCIRGCDHSPRSEHDHSLITSSPAPQPRRLALLPASAASRRLTAPEKLLLSEVRARPDPVVSAIRTVVLLV